MRNFFTTVAALSLALSLATPVLAEDAAPVKQQVNLIAVSADGKTVYHVWVYKKVSPPSLAACLVLIKDAVSDAPATEAAAELKNDAASIMEEAKAILAAHEITDVVGVLACAAEDAS